ncbi:hypothetical protein C2S52_004889 [Perilla frutescens var. hirtella]|uniref:Uncharacterized protein n=1 Tax=Perilla frutescens var. hirtella TaxID=608512 RepID=A0AAD4J8C1_PERFH|nr:hypothetical protein C2S52_004889 [Perilla frutescens var. hirtella]KAH6828829.1 hypothetical protein C2S53_013667 [Perilla frutescens var. hirtella]
MEAAGKAKSLIDKIMPPRLEDAGLEDCALPPESIKEAFLKAASAVRSTVSDSGDEGGCVEDPWEDSSDVLVGITDGVTAPSEGCAVEKGGGLTEAPGDKVVVGGGDAEAKAADAVVGPGVPEGGEPCVDGLQGLEIRGKGRGILGKKKLKDDEEKRGDDKKENPY